ncbi:mannitol dehydrogenase, partial [Rhodoferax fermentans]|nr:mannitol dehydrogenase [Rhodoferax fermentans]
MHLNKNSLSHLPATVTRPSYDRSQVVGSIVHLGIGAFHRAHQAMFTEAVLASGDLAWGI